MTAILESLRSEYLIHLIILGSIYLILAQSLNLTIGLGQIFNLSHISAYAVGAYTTAVLATEVGAPTWLCVGASLVLGGAFGFLGALVARRLSTDYLAIGTLALSALISALLVNWRDLTRGVLGITAIPRPEIAGFNFYPSGSFLVLAASAALAIQLFFALLFRSPFGRALRALAQSESGAAALGVNSRWVRGAALIVSGGGAALAGSLFAYYLNYIDPSSFGLSEMIFVLTIVIVGRPGSLWGVTAGTAFLIVLPEILRLFPLDSSILGPLRQLMYALILFTVVWRRRDSLFPEHREV